MDTRQRITVRRRKEVHPEDTGITCCEVKTKVIDSYPISNGIIRMRECKVCKGRFRTTEREG